MELQVVQQRKPQYPYKGPENAAAPQIRQRLKQQTDLRYRAKQAAAREGMSPEEYASAPNRHKMAQAFNLAPADALIPDRPVSAIVVVKNAILTGIDALKQLTLDANPKLAKHRDDAQTCYLIKQLWQHLRQHLPIHMMERDPGRIGGARGRSDKRENEPRARARWLASRVFLSGQDWPPTMLAELTAYLQVQIAKGTQIMSPTAYAIAVAWKWAHESECYWHEKHAFMPNRDRFASHKHFMAKPGVHPRAVRGYDLVADEVKSGPSPSTVPPKKVSADDKSAEEPAHDMDFHRRFRASPWGKRWTAMLDADETDYSELERLQKVFRESEIAGSDPPAADTG